MKDESDFFLNWPKEYFSIDYQKKINNNNLFK